MANRVESDRRYRDKLKAERVELRQLREEKKRWEEDRKQWERERERWQKEGKLVHTVSEDSSSTDQDSEAQLDKEARRMEVRARYEARRTAEAAQAASTTTTTPPKKPTPTDSGDKKDPPRLSSSAAPQLRLFISFDDLDTQEKVKRSLQMGELADMSEAFQKTLFQGDPVLRQEWEDYQEIVLGRGSAVASHTPTEPNVTRLVN